jgi:predicted GIY-YIG superfamily endonuclease
METGKSSKRMARALRQEANIWTFYLLISLDSKTTQTHAGVTNNMRRRLRQHNASRSEQWTRGVTVEPFDKRQAANFEYAFKRGTSAGIPKGIHNRLHRLHILTREDIWRLLSLKVEFHDRIGLSIIFDSFSCPAPFVQASTNEDSTDILQECTLSPPLSPLGIPPRQLSALCYPSRTTSNAGDSD